MKLENLFLLALGSKQKLKWYLDNNINLINYLNSAWPQYMFLATTTLALIPKDKLREELGEINSKRILKLLERERLDLHKIINIEKGLVWLEREIQGFKDYFL